MTCYSINYMLFGAAVQNKVGQKVRQTWLRNVSIIQHSSNALLS